jgi:hypothetical protein
MHVRDESLRLVGQRARDWENTVDTVSTGLLSGFRKLAGRPGEKLAWRSAREARL